MVISENQTVKTDIEIGNEFLNFSNYNNLDDLYFKSNELFG